MSMYLWNGKLVEEQDVQVSLHDRGYYFGDGIYEVFRIYQGMVFEKEAHLLRLLRSAAEIRITLPWSPEELSRHIDMITEDARSTHPGEDGIIYLQITRGAAPRIHTFPENCTPVILGYFKPYPRPLASMEQGLTAVTAEDIRWLRCDIKTLNLLPNTLAKQEAADRGAGEIIFIRNYGGQRFVTECSASNLMIVKDGVILTHPADNLILHGISRAVVLRLADKLGLPVRQEKFAPEALETADEAFLTGTTVEVTPIISIDGRPVGSGTPGPVTRRLQQAFTEAALLHKVQQS